MDPEIEFLDYFLKSFPDCFRDTLASMADLRSVMISAETLEALHASMRDLCSFNGNRWNSELRAMKLDIGRARRDDVLFAVANYLSNYIITAAVYEGKRDMSGRPDPDGDYRIVLSDKDIAWYDWGHRRMWPWGDVDRKLIERLI